MHPAFLLNCLALEDEPISCPETSPANYQSTLRNIQEERRSHYKRYVNKALGNDLMLTVHRR